MKETNDNKSSIEGKRISRRDFIKVAGVIAVGATTTGFSSCIQNDQASQGYILVDTGKCQGCMTCMLSCSLAHEGYINPSLSRIQIVQNSFACWPDDISIEQCRQCEYPKCVEHCPVNAMYIDKENGNIRRVDKDVCVGCGKCTKACPYEPRIPIVVPDAEFDMRRKARKCDLCIDTPYHQYSVGGGPDGKQMCIESCPVGAIAFSSKLPFRFGDYDGYKPILRDANWVKLGYPLI